MRCHLTLGLSVLLVISSFAPLSAQVRIKDIAAVENIAQKSLIGYGLVVGLNGTGDRSSGTRGTVFTIQSISNMLERFGITIPKAQLRTRNVAAVMLTAKTPPFGRIGTLFDVTVSSLGDATSLEGGVLLMSPLLAADNKIYAMAQGPVSIGGYNIESEAGERVRKNHALVGRIPNGAMLEDVPTDQKFDLTKPLRLILTEPDYMTANRVAEEINVAFIAKASPGNSVADASKIAQPINAGVIEIEWPESVRSQNEIVGFIAAVETLKVEPDVEARVVINERTGTIVAGGNVKIGEVMISHGNLTIHVKRQPVISQPQAAFSNAGRTVVDYVTETTVSEADAQVAVIPTTTTVNDLALALNDLALRPRDIIAIFQAIKQAGALNARLIIM